MVAKEQIESYFRQLQDDICSALEAADGQGKFQQDLWQRPQGGGGRTRIIKGQHIEKGGVNFSAVFGDMPPAVAKGLEMDGGEFFASGVSIVLHPNNPLVPIIHMNVRYFESNDQWWFGGGIDLTPHYIEPEQARFFHEQLKQVCDQHHPDFYAKYKTWADDYFFLPHRKETRGVGGIFFDRLNEKKGLTKEACFAFVRAVGEAFAPTYIHLLHLNKDKVFGEQEKAWQRLRRGRYVEFNLVWDRGTKFGLHTGGRTESILMSLPPMASWAYDHQPTIGSKEAATLALLRKDVDWINHK
ncbi:MAG: oxygen-dependent coproporphyrinogen oxidase [Bacteroidota bacterium]